VNNVMYVRYAESARVGWTNNFAVHVDPEHKREWEEISTPKGVGMILRSIRIDYKFVCYILFFSGFEIEGGES
jgi:acyl-CoA thioesterase FadM